MLHPSIIAVENQVIHGRGLTATALIREGEVVSRLDPGLPTIAIAEILTWSQEKQTELLRYGYQCDDKTIVMEKEPERYMNHSCDPNTWWLDNDTMIARRDILPNEEITYDYASTEITIPYVMICGCGSLLCRHRITNLDYLIPDWQKRFGNYVPEHVRNAILASKQR